MLALLLTLALLAAAACSQGRPSHLGTWQSSITEEITLRINDDGTIDEYWEDTLTATYPYEADADTLTVDQSGDKYTLSLEDGKLVYMGETLYTKK